MNTLTREEKNFFILHFFIILIYTNNNKSIQHQQQQVQNISTSMASAAEIDIVVRTEQERKMMLREKHTMPMPSRQDEVLLGNCFICYQLGPLNWYCSTCWKTECVTFNNESGTERAGDIIMNENVQYILVGCRESNNGQHNRVFKPENLAKLMNSFHLDCHHKQH